jgi:hypothetical protein
MNAKLIFSGLILLIFWGGTQLAMRYLLTDVVKIRKKFLISTAVDKGHVDIGGLMAQEIQAVPGRRGSSSGSSSYVPRLSTIKRASQTYSKKNTGQMRFPTEGGASNGGNIRGNSK